VRVARPVRRAGRRNRRAVTPARHSGPTPTPPSPASFDCFPSSSWSSSMSSPACPSPPKSSGKNPVPDRWAGSFSGLRFVSAHHDTLSPIRESSSPPSGFARRCDGSARGSASGPSANGSIAIIERLWRTLKDALRLRSFKPLTKRELQRRLELGFYYYTYLRPHQGLGGATPAEIHFGRERAHLAAVHPPRARPREGPADSPFEIAFLDPDQLLPVLIRKAA